MRLTAVHGYEEEEEIDLAGPYLFPFLTGWSLPRGAHPLPRCFWAPPSWWCLVCGHVTCTVYVACLWYMFIQVWRSRAETETRHRRGSWGEDLASTRRQTAHPSKSSWVGGLWNTRQARGEGLVNERLPGNLERCLEGVSSPPSPSLTPLSSFSIVLWAFKAPQELCNSVQDLVYFDVRATETQSIKFWQSVRYKSVMRPLGISFWQD